MATSRMRRLEEKNARRKLMAGIIGIVAVSVFLLLFGFRLLIAFSLFVDRIRGGSAVPVQETDVLMPPVLDPLPQATNSATITIHGSAEPGNTVLLFLNGDEYRRLDVTEDGMFTVEDIPVEPGKVTVSARATDGNESVSDISNTISTVIDRTPPDLAITKPEDGTTINDGTHRVSVEGKTDTDARVTINGRIVVVRSEGTFSYSMPIEDGDNTLSFVSTDLAGNSIEIERNVTYQP